MKPIQFEGANVLIGEHQEEYMSVPAQIVAGQEGKVISCWQLSDDDLMDIIRTKRVYVDQLTFNQPLQPIRLYTKYDGPK